MQFFNGVELQMNNYHAGSPALPAPGKQISGYLPASGSRTALTWIFLCCFTWRTNPLASTSLHESSRVDTDLFSGGDRVNVHVSPSTRRSSRLSLVFWLLVFFLKTLIGKMALLSAMEAFNMEDVFFFLLRSNVDTCRRGVLVSSPSLFTTVPRTSLVVLVFFLVGGGCLLPTRYISREDVDELILPRVLIFFLH